MKARSLITWLLSCGSGSTFSHAGAPEPCGHLHSQDQSQSALGPLAPGQLASYSASAAICLDSSKNSGPNTVNKKVEAAPPAASPSPCSTCARVPADIPVAAAAPAGCAVAETPWGGAGNLIGALRCSSSGCCSLCVAPGPMRLSPCHPSSTRPITRSSTDLPAGVATSSLEPPPPPTTTTTTTETPALPPRLARRHSLLLPPLASANAAAADTAAAAGGKGATSEVLSAKRRAVSACSSGSGAWSTAAAVAAMRPAVADAAQEIITDVRRTVAVVGGGGGGATAAATAQTASGLPDASLQGDFMCCSVLQSSYTGIAGMAGGTDCRTRTTGASVVSGFAEPSRWKAMTLNDLVDVFATAAAADTLTHHQHHHRQQQQQQQQEEPAQGDATGEAAVVAAAATVRDDANSKTTTCDASSATLASAAAAVTAAATAGDAVVATCGSSTCFWLEVADPYNLLMTAAGGAAEPGRAARNPLDDLPMYYADELDTTVFSMRRAEFDNGYAGGRGADGGGWQKAAADCSPAVEAGEIVVLDIRSWPHADAGGRGGEPRDKCLRSDGAGISGEDTGSAVTATAAAAGCGQGSPIRGLDAAAVMAAAADGVETRERGEEEAAAEEDEDAAPGLELRGLLTLMATHRPTHGSVTAALRPVAGHASAAAVVSMTAVSGGCTAFAADDAACASSAYTSTGVGGSAAAAAAAAAVPARAGAEPVANVGAACPGADGDFGDGGSSSCCCCFVTGPTTEHLRPSEDIPHALMSNSSRLWAALALMGAGKPPLSLHDAVQQTALRGAPHPEDLDGLFLGPIESYGGTGVVTFRATSACGQNLLVKVTEVPYGVDMSYISAVADCRVHYGAAGGGGGGDGPPCTASAAAAGAGPAAAAAAAKLEMTATEVLASLAGEEAEVYRTVCQEAVQSAIEVSCLSTLSHPNIAQVCSWHCGVCMELAADTAAAGAFAETGRRRGAAGGGGGGSMLKLRPATYDDLHYDANAEAAAAAAQPSSPVCVALVTACDLGSLETALARGLFASGGAATIAATAAAAAAAAGPMVRLDWKAILRTLLDVALALRYLHDRGVVHRSVQPSAVQLYSTSGDPRGFTAKLAEFGLVVRQPLPPPPPPQPSLPPSVDFPAAGPLYGIPPEVFLGAPPRADGDVYAFGYLMYCCSCTTTAAAAAPFGGVAIDVRQVLELVLRGARPALGPHVPVPYRRLAQACWSEDAARRPPAAELVTNLTAMLRTM